MASIFLCIFSPSHLLRGLALVKKHSPEGYNKIANQLEGYHFGSVIDMVMFFEC